MAWNLAINLTGGIGLILLGMKLMTGGLKVATGSVLKNFLARWTRTPLHGLFSGIIITSLVQSSGAVALAAIGFVNAGFMSISQALWVVFGSNVGTTTTTWIVAFLGLKVNIKAFALPFVGLGMGLYLTGRGGRRAGIGEALAGFGLFFLGIDAMETAFKGLETGIPIETLAGYGLMGLLAFVLIGFVLTFLMQSSSGAIALILTATAGGVVPFNMAAAAVIGANVGSTTTALIASIGATSNAKRVAVAHVAFNLLTGAVALAVLPLILYSMFRVQSTFDLALAPASMLAVFHTIFNLLGVLLMWRITPRLVSFLRNRFKTQEEDESRPRYLDNTLADSPSIGINALLKETGRIGAVASRVAKGVISCRNRPCRDLHSTVSIIDNLQQAVGDFSVRLRKQGLAEEASVALPRIIRVSQYYKTAADMALLCDTLLARAGSLESWSFRHEASELFRHATEVVDNAVVENSTYSPERREETLREFLRRYATVKESVLTAGVNGEITIEQMDNCLEGFSSLKRLVEQVTKGSRLLEELTGELSPEAVHPPQDELSISPAGHQSVEPADVSSGPSK